jgi:hypothetical protein
MLHSPSIHLSLPRTHKGKCKTNVASIVHNENNAKSALNQRNIYALFAGATPADRTLGNSASPTEYKSPIAQATTNAMAIVKTKNRLNGTDTSCFWHPCPAQWVTCLWPPSGDFLIVGLQTQLQQPSYALAHSPWDEHELVEFVQASMVL